LFGLYDVHGLGFHEDPQAYWRPAVSLLHHGIKPLSAVWLFVGAAWLSVAALPGSQARRAPARRPKLVGAVTVALLLVGGVSAARWAAGAILEQRRSGPDRVWAPPIFQEQMHSNTCGPAALASVCRYFGIGASEDEIAALAGTTDAGTSMQGLQRAAERKGLTAMGRRVGFEELERLPQPTILYFHPGHFAILTGVKDGRFTLADPSRGQRVWTRQQLAQLWRGELLIVGPADAAPARGG
ncbi:MAG TPA: cysteine peptidase family C39 domain-containing protein, partial [Chthonomonadaceae bacterium]|nr:cysteine peptidase family C39 domain-containing protein [Chthonomonadaceae bacterium]